MCERALDAQLEPLPAGTRFFRGYKAVILDAIFEAAIAGWRDFPIELQLEIGVVILAEQIFGDARMWVGLEASIFDGPGIARGCFQTRVVPIAHGLAVEKENPACLAFIRCESVGRTGKQRSSGKHRQKCGLISRHGLVQVIKTEPTPRR